jgi:ATP-binding cassette subfamily B protein
MEGKTSIVIAHHLNSIRHADIVLVVKDTELVEQGTHEELLAADGLYAELYRIQTSEGAGRLAEQHTAR